MAETTKTSPSGHRVRYCVFEKDRDTKHTTRYKECTDDESTPVVIGTLYVQKWFAQGAERIEVSITATSGEAE